MPRPLRDFIYNVWRRTSDSTDIYTLKLLYTMVSFLNVSCYVNLDYEDHLVGNRKLWFLRNKAWLLEFFDCKKCSMESMLCREYIDVLLCNNILHIKSFMCFLMRKYCVTQGLIVLGNVSYVYMRNCMSECAATAIILLERWRDTCNNRKHTINRVIWRRLKVYGRIISSVYG